MYTFEILQQEYAVTTATDSKPVLSTNGVHQCVALALYNHENKIAGLAHIDEVTDITSIGLFIKDVSNNKKIIAYLSSDKDYNSKKLFNNIILFLQKKKVKISKNIGASSSLTIDARTGKIHLGIISQRMLTKDLLRRDKNIENNLLSYKRGDLFFPLSKVYDGRKK